MKPNNRHCIIATRLAALALYFLVLGLSTVHAAITIDPNGAGATNVVELRGSNTELIASTLSSLLQLDGRLVSGHTAAGEILIDNSSRVINGVGIVGNQPNSVGVATVDGRFASWTNEGTLYVGREGSGTLHITNRATVTNGDYAEIAYLPGSSGTVTVDGAGTTWTSDIWINVGRYGDASLAISNGGKVSNRISNVGTHSGASGQVTVDGNGSQWLISNELLLGGEGTGKLFISNGGVVDVANATRVGSRDSSVDSEISFNNGTLITQSLLAGLEDLKGTGTIIANGLVNDLDLVLNASQPSISRITLDSLPGQDITIDLDMNGSGAMGAGYRGQGSLTIEDGVVLQSNDGYLGVTATATGIATVRGVGSTWNAGNNLNVGVSGMGSLNVVEGGVASSSSGYLGLQVDSDPAKAIGTATVDGPGSMWNNNHNLYIGSKATGILNISNGGTVNVAGSTWVGYFPEGSGSISFNNGSLRTGNLLADETQLSGTGTIYTNGSVSDFDLVFDATRGAHHTFTLSDNPSQNITIELSVDGQHLLGTGYRGSGTLTIGDGVTVESTQGYLGYHGGSNGVAAIDGENSHWISSSTVFVGVYGNGELHIADGGLFTAQSTILGWRDGSTSIVSVDGVGSTLAVVRDLEVGRDGSGQLTIANGGLVKVARRLAIDQDRGGDGYVQLSTGGMLALFGNADTSIEQFLGLASGSDDIRFWDDDLGDWSLIRLATRNDDYTLQYQTTGELAGYTLLTVGSVPVPEPSAIVLVLAFVCIAFAWVRSPHRVS